MLKNYEIVTIKDIADGARLHTPEAFAVKAKELLKKALKDNKKLIVVVSPSNLLDYNIGNTLERQGIQGLPFTRRVAEVAHAVLVMYPNKIVILKSRVNIDFSAIEEWCRSS